ncbi:MAG TPA: IclR family transcriptional regulator [Alphaproteobacteria bacterium]|nr:IclR family transcriptional regulator [Alphaproteobacteria bacterium]
MNQRTPAAPAEDESGEATVKTIDRAARLLRAVATHGDGAMLSAVARETGLGKGTVHRLLNALVDAGFVFQDLETKRYRLGAGLGLLGQAAHRQDLAALARPSLLRLAEATEDTIYASLREGGTAVCVAREIGAFPIRTLSLDAGHVRPLGVGSGSLALLAFLPDDEVHTIVDRNAAWYARYPGHTRKALLADVAETRQRGYSFVDGKIVPGMNAVGVPVLDQDGRAAAAISLAAIADRVSGARIRELVGLLTREAASLAEAMGLPAACQLRAPKRAHGV